MARTAKVSLTADVRGFKGAVDDARKSLASLKDIDVAPESAKKLKDLISKDLIKQADTVKTKMEEISVNLEKIASGQEAFDSRKVVNYTAALKNLKQQLKDINTEQANVDKGAFGDFKDKFMGSQIPGMGGAKGGGGKGIMGSLGGLKSLIAPVLGALGVRAMFGRATGIADERLAQRALTRDAGYVGEDSKYGYLPSERRQSAAMFASQAGAIDSGRLTGLVDMGEQIERAYGVKREDSASFTGAARRAGVSDTGKALSNSIGAAVAAGLEGSKIGEYLNGMRGFMEEMSQGINVDNDSLNGFAAAMGTLPFFKNDPSRIFSALRSMDQTFKGGDRFQQAMGTRAILASAPGASASATEFRRSMGLFGELDEGTLKQLDAAGVDTRAMRVGGADVVSNMFKDIMSSTEGMSPDDQLYAFQQRTGLEAGPAAEIFAQLKSGRPDMKGISDKLKEAAMSPEERLNKTFKNAEGSIKDLEAKIDRLIEVISMELVPPLVKFVQWITSKMGQAEGLFDTVQNTGETVATGAMMAGGLYAGSKAMGAAGAVAKSAPGKAVGRGLQKFGGKAAQKVLPKTLAKGGAKAVGQAIPFVGNAINAVAAYQKYQEIEDKGGWDKASKADKAALMAYGGGTLFPWLGWAGLGADVYSDFQGGGDAGPQAPAGGGAMMPTPSDKMATGGFDINNITNPTSALSSPLSPQVGSPMIPPSIAAPRASAPSLPSVSLEDTITRENTIAIQGLTQAIIRTKPNAYTPNPSYANPTRMNERAVGKR
jgi:hypothetical protein